MTRLTHFDAEGNARMVDVSEKTETERVAVAEGAVLMAPETLALIKSGGVKKGDVLSVAQLAGIMGAKKTPDLIPLCHPLALSSVTVELVLDEQRSAVAITATCKLKGRTGVEMEALTAVSVAALTVYDMVKAVDKGMRITEIRLTHKSGGKSGTFEAPVMLSVAEASERILAAFAPLGSEVVPIDQALGRVLAKPVIARLDHPPQAVTAMDGYAVRAADVTALPAKLKVVESIAAGTLPSRAIGAGEASRIFTGGAVPLGADCIVIQENTTRHDDVVSVVDGSHAPGRHIRPTGNDFRQGSVGVEAGRRLTPSDIGLAAAMNWPEVEVTCKPKIAIISTGNELAPPGAALAPGQIVASNGLALAAFVASCGGEPVHLGIARDEPAALAALIDRAAGAELLLTSGGASVGDHDLVQSVLTSKGMELGFWKIAMRPGKPLMFGTLGALRVIGLPGNPVSALVTATLFVGPAIARMLGLAQVGPRIVRARLGIDLPANDVRQDYLRSAVVEDADGLVATPFGKQDSAMLSALSRSGGLVIRPPHAPAAKAGDAVEMVLLG